MPKPLLDFQCRPVHCRRESVVLVGCLHLLLLCRRASSQGQAPQFRLLLVLCLLVPFRVAAVESQRLRECFRLAVVQVVAAGFRRLLECCLRVPFQVAAVVSRHLLP